MRTANTEIRQCVKWSLTNLKRCARRELGRRKEEKEWVRERYNATYMCPQTRSIFFLLFLSFYPHVNDPGSSKFLSTNIWTLLQFFCLDTITTLPRAQALLVITVQNHGKASKVERRKAGSTWKAFPWSLCRNTVEIPTAKHLCTTSGTTHIRIRSNRFIIIAAAVVEHVGMQNMITYSL